MFEAYVARHTRSGPLPLVGRGWGGGRAMWHQRCITEGPPSPALPQPAAGLPASGKFKVPKPRQAGVWVGREQTEFAARADPYFTEFW